MTSPPPSRLTPNAAQATQTGAQATLFDETIQSRFEAWLADNPAVWRMFCEYARRLQASGRRHYGAAAIVEAMRYDAALTTTGDVFKIDNDFRSRLARKLMSEDASFRDFFEVRTIRSA